MSRPKTCITNVETGEVIVREYTDEEMIEHEKLLVRRETEKAEAEAKAAQKQEILDRLGLTAEEAQILLGGN